MTKPISFAYSVEDLMDDGNERERRQRRRVGNGNRKKQIPAKRKSNNPKIAQMERRRQRRQQRERVRTPDNEQHELAGQLFLTGGGNEKELKVDDASSRETAKTTNYMSRISSSSSSSKPEHGVKKVKKCVAVGIDKGCSSRSSSSKSGEQKNESHTSKSCSGGKESLFQNAIAPVQKANRNDIQHKPLDKISTSRNEEQATNTKSSSSEKTSNDQFLATAAADKAETKTTSTESSSASTNAAAADVTSQISSSSSSSAAATASHASRWSKKKDQPNKSETRGLRSKEKPSAWGKPLTSSQKRNGWGGNSTATKLASTPSIPQKRNFNTMASPSSTHASTWSSSAKNTLSPSWGSSGSSGEGWESKKILPAKTKDTKQTSWRGDSEKNEMNANPSSWGKPTRQQAPYHGHYAHSPSSSRGSSSSSAYLPQRNVARIPPPLPPHYNQNSHFPQRRGRPPPHNIYTSHNHLPPETFHFPPRSILPRQLPPPQPLRPLQNFHGGNQNRRRSNYHNNNYNYNQGNERKRNRRENNYNPAVSSWTAHQTNDARQGKQNVSKNTQHLDASKQKDNTKETKKQQQGEKNGQDIHNFQVVKNESQSTSSSLSEHNNTGNLQDTNKKGKGINFKSFEGKSNKHSNDDGDDAAKLWDNPKTVKKKEEVKKVPLLNHCTDNAVAIAATKKAPKSRQDLALEQIEEVLPDVDPDHARKLLSKEGVVPDDMHETNADVVFVSSSSRAIQAVLEELLQSESSYPKRRTPVTQDDDTKNRHKLKKCLTNMSAKEEIQKTQNKSTVSAATIECQCCYVSYAFEEMVSCRDEGHLFCVTCLRRHAEERIFGVGKLGWGGVSNDNGDSTSAETGKAMTMVEQTPELLCMHSGGCQSIFQREQLVRALSEKVMTKYDELQFTMAVEKAGVEDICKCPKCGFQAVLPPSEMIYQCPLCDYESCRSCGEPPHIPLKCSEVEKEYETRGRKTVEEAMTAARVRTCPRINCKKEFFKVEGCNKMTCACGINICYVCRAEIPKSVGYQHFCQTPHCKHERCNKCPLYSNAKEDDERAMREAGLKAAKEVQESSLRCNNIINYDNVRDFGGHCVSSSREIKIDVGALLKDPANAEKKNDSSWYQAARPPLRGGWGQAGGAVVRGAWGHNP